MLEFAPKLLPKNPNCSAGTDIKICETAMSETEIFSDAVTPWLTSVVFKVPFDYFWEISYLRLLNDLLCWCWCIWSGKTQGCFWAKKNFPESFWTLSKPVSLLLCLTVEVLVGRLCVSRSDIQNKWEKICIALVQYRVWWVCKQKFAWRELKNVQTLGRTKNFRVLVCFEKTSKISVKKSFL